MQPSEYDNLAAVEAQHWYYAGKRDIVRHWLEQSGGLGSDRQLLDFGAGTGGFAQWMQRDCQVKVLDDHEESLNLLRERFPAEAVLQPEEGRIPVEAGSLDAITALDVLEHVPDDQAVVNEFARVVRPGGVVVVTVPAFMLLWSDWDVVLHHFRRYRQPQLGALFDAQTWEMKHLGYTNFFAFPIVLLVRKGGQLLRRCGLRGSMRAEDRLPPLWINRIARWLFVAPAKAGLRPPWGVSLLLVARRR